MAEDWTARGSLAGLDIEIRGGHADRGEYLVLALKGTPDLERALAALTPLHLAAWPMAWPMMNPFQPWLEFWRAAWGPWLALGQALAAPAAQQPRQEQP
jgi:hypothetical protein